MKNRLYKIWLKEGNKKGYVMHYSPLEPGQLYYHLKYKAPRIEGINEVYNVNSYSSFWVEEVKEKQEPKRYLYQVSLFKGEREEFVLHQSTDDKQEVERQLKANTLKEDLRIENYTRYLIKEI